MINYLAKRRTAEPRGSDFSSEAQAGDQRVPKVADEA